MRPWQHVNLFPEEPDITPIQQCLLLVEADKTTGYNQTPGPCLYKGSSLCHHLHVQTTDLPTITHWAWM